MFQRFLQGPAAPSPDLRTLEDENARLKEEIRRVRQPSIPPPRVKVDQQRALELSLQDIRKAPPEILQCSLHLVGQYVPLDKTQLTRIFDLLNATQDVSNGTGARIEEIMSFSGVSWDQADDLCLVIGALLCHILAASGNVGYAFAAAYLQIRGNRASQYSSTMTKEASTIDANSPRQNGGGGAGSTFF